MNLEKYDEAVELFTRFRKVYQENKKDNSQSKIIEHADVRRMLLFQKAVVEGSLSLIMECGLYEDLSGVVDEDQKEKYHLLLDLLTPIAKTYPSE
ncbi:MAG: hypothetical protein HC908_07395, partial [Calothrix sp. SM1_7_51]|nr:hypothetical protein [Calothrix sp. SM1_7_51]